MFKKALPDLLIGLFVLCIAGLILVPQPTWLISILISTNIAFSLLLLLIGLSLESALAILSFPSIILLATLFRLSLNIASTRLILSNGDAGQVIASFGTFLIGDEIVVGLIIFLIITLVNFVVIARGASRISEVAARFVLDSLPGKQLAIDSDLRSGIISAEQSKKKREDLRKESQLYGNLDGAMRFIQGDVIAGIFIILINIFGGIWMGFKSGLNFEQALETYTTLAVGDGLVTQIPALLIAMCAGIIVTRVSSGENSSLSLDLGKQIFRNTNILIICSLVMLAIAFLPGLPKTPFIITSLLLFSLAMFTRFKSHSSITNIWEVSKNEEFGLIGNDSLKLKEQGLIGKSIVLELGNEFWKIYQVKPNFYHKYWNSLAKLAKEKNCFGLPILKFLEVKNLSSSEWKLKEFNTYFLQGKFKREELFFDTNAENLKLFNLFQNSKNIFFGKRYSCIQNNQPLAPVVKKLNLNSYNNLEIVLYKIYNHCLKNPEMFISLTELHTRLKDIENHYPGLFTELFEKKFIDPSRFREILVKLLKSDFQIHSIKDLLELISLYSSTAGNALYKSNDFDADDIVRFIRTKRPRQNYFDKLKDGKYLKTILIGENTEEYFLNFNSQNEKSKRETLNSLNRIINNTLVRNSLNVVLLCPDSIFIRLRKFMSKFSVPMTLVAYQEIDEQTQIEPITIWNL